MKNEEKQLARSYHNSGSYEMDQIMQIAKFERGDTLHIQLTGGTIYGSSSYNQSSFHGFLIYSGDDENTYDSLEEQETPRVAFNFARKSSISATAKPLIFDQEVINLGNGYLNGIFTGKVRVFIKCSFIFQIEIFSNYF